MASETQLALAALVVALVALLTAISQALSQLFATADGYRRCQSAIIGGWAKLTKRKFRWTELRFETIYTTPRIVIAPYIGQSHRPTSPVRRTKGLSSAPKANCFPLDGTPSMIRTTFSGILDGYPGHDEGVSEMASWVRLIDALHSNGADTRAYINLNERRALKSHDKSGSVNIVMPHVMPQKHSWDFVPPEVIRPLAVISLHHLAISARRLGMSWLAFQPSEGALRAEGNGHILDSTTVRSVGTVIQVSIREPLHTHDHADHLYVPTELADKMGFGMLPGDKDLHIPDYNIGNPKDCLARTLEIDRRAGDSLKSTMGNYNDWTPGISEIIGFATPMIRLRGSTIIKVPKPSQYEGGLTLQEEGFVVFHNRLRGLVNERDDRGEPVSEQTRWVLQQYEELLLQYGKQWEDQHATKGNKTSISFLDDLHARHDATTLYFDNLQHPRGNWEKVMHQQFRYTDLMHSHITHAVDYYYKARDILNAGQGRDHYGMQVQGWITEGAHVYFDQIPKVSESMKQRGFDNPRIVEEAWFTMMLRAFLWHRAHLMVDGNRVPSQHWGSRLPVYIG